MIHPVFRFLDRLCAWYLLVFDGFSARFPFLMKFFAKIVRLLFEFFHARFEVLETAKEFEFRDFPPSD